MASSKRWSAIRGSAEVNHPQVVTARLTPGWAPRWATGALVALAGVALALVGCAAAIRPGPSLIATEPALATTAAQSAEALTRPAFAAEPALQPLLATPTPLPPPTATATRPPAPPVRVRTLPAPQITAEMAVIVDEASGAVLWGHDEHREVAPASLTKIVTAMVAIELGDPRARVTVDVDSRAMHDSTVMGLRPGEEVSLEDLLYGLMLPSGNDAALAIARHIAGSDERFVELMNARVRALGLQHTQFRNPHGLDAEGHYSSPYDMAMLARAAMRDPLFQRLAAAKEWECSGLLQSYRLVNLNRLLWRYPGADGVKIGYTDDAGRTMVVSATRDGHRVYASFMRSRDLVRDGTALLDWAFGSYVWAQRW
jgi:D-alanyl-D-alanine carboxypeptidase